METSSVPATQINVALAFSDPDGSYARHAAVVLASIFKNTAHSVCVYVLHDASLSEWNRRKLEETAQVFSQELHFVDVSDFVENQKKSPPSELAGMSYRLFIPHILDLEKVIYLDCDIVVNIDIADLWCQPLDGKPIGAVQDILPNVWKKLGFVFWMRINCFYKAIGLSAEHYFNSGVLLMDLEKIREIRDFCGQVATFYERYGNAAMCVDQDCLNYIFKNNWHVLDGRFNRLDTSGDISKEETSGYIWHYATSEKPWFVYSRKNIDLLYWHYLKYTAYCKDEDDFTEMMLEGLGNSRVVHRRARDCAVTLIQRIAHRLYLNSIRLCVEMLKVYMASFLRKK